MHRLACLALLLAGCLPDGTDGHPTDGSMTWVLNNQTAAPAQFTLLGDAQNFGPFDVPVGITSHEFSCTVGDRFRVVSMAGALKAKPSPYYICGLDNSIEVVVSVGR